MRTVLMATKVRKKYYALEERNVRNEPKHFFKEKYIINMLMAKISRRES